MIEPGSVEKIIGMELKDYFSSGKYTTVYYDLFGEEIGLAANDVVARANKSDGLVSYTAKEIKRIRDAKLDEQELLAVHKAKKAIKGYLAEIIPPEQNNT
jgi:hypothetical protein